MEEEEKNKKRITGPMKILIVGGIILVGFVSIWVWANYVAPQCPLR